MEALWNSRKQPLGVHVFLNRFGQPYADTRNDLYPGGNPIRKATRRLVDEPAPTTSEFTIGGTTGRADA